MIDLQSLGRNPGLFLLPIAPRRTIFTPMKKNFDIVIVGGGLAGLSLSCLLGHGGLSVACVDQADPKIKPQDLRTTAISYGSRQILERTGVWPRIKETCPIKDIQILDGGSPVLLEFISGEVEDKAFGWIVDNHDLKTALLAEMKSLKTISHIAPAKVADYELGEQGGKVHLEGDETLTAKLIVGADGRNSQTRLWMERHFDLHTRQWSYNQRAVICTAAHENPHNNIAVEHFFPAGPLAILPAADDKGGAHRSSVVFTEHGPEKASMMRLSDTEFETLLSERFPDWYGAVHMVGRRACYPLGLVHADRYIAHKGGAGMVLVADAAHGIHPIAGQGLNLGFRDLGELSTLVNTAHANGKDIAALELLETYQRRRRPDNMAMVAMTDGLNRLFSNNLKSVRFLRRTGLKIVSRLKPAKDFFMKQAMGDR